MIPHTLIYHITHGRNLESILKAGGLHSFNSMVSHQHAYVNIAYNSVQSRRAVTKVPIPPYGVLHDYVPFYFAPRSPMLYAIHKNRVEHYQGGQFPILYLVSAVEAIQNAKKEFVFTDGHAIIELSEFYSDLDDLINIDWTIMSSTYWNDTQEDRDRSRRRQAEFLIRDFVEWELIQGIGVMDQRIATRVREILYEYGAETPIKVKREWYY